MAIILTPVTRTSDTPNIESAGAFQAGQTSLFFITFSDIDGTLFDPSNIDITIRDADGNVADTIAAADQVKRGRYAIEWDIPSTATPGLYTLEVDYTNELATGAEIGFISENFVITETDIDTQQVELLAFRSFVETLIGYAQRIPVFDEIGRLNNTRTKSYFSFPRWNQPAGYKLYVNGDLQDAGIGHEVDYLKGIINFNVPLSSVDEVTVKYNFRWFKDNELDDFIGQALQVWNQYTPQTVVQFNTLPSRFGPTVAHQAAVFALRRIIMDLHFQEPAKVFGGMERADKLIGSFDTLKKNMEEDLNNWYEQKKYGPYTGLTMTVTVPEFTLPGGRSRWFRALFKGS